LSPPAQSERIEATKKRGASMIRVGDENIGLGSGPVYESDGRGGGAAVAGRRTGARRRRLLLLRPHGPACIAGRPARRRLARAGEKNVRFHATGGRRRGAAGLSPVASAAVPDRSGPRLRAARGGGWAGGACPAHRGRPRRYRASNARLAGRPPRPEPAFHFHRVLQDDHRPHPEGVRGGAPRPGACATSWFRAATTVTDAIYGRRLQLERGASYASLPRRCSE